MAKLSVDISAVDDLRKAKSDQAAAWRVLRRLADYLKRGEVVPANIARHFINAIDTTLAAKSAGQMGPTFAQASGLSRKANRPASADWLEVAAFVYKETDADTSRTAAIALAKRKFGIKASTIRDYCKTYATALEEIDRINSEN